MINLEQKAEEYADNPDIVWGPRKAAIKAAYIAGGEESLKSLWKDPRKDPPKEGILVLCKMYDGTHEICALDETGKQFEAPKVDHALIFGMCEVKSYMELYEDTDEGEDDFCPRNKCPEFPFFGATYPDAGCVNGILHDLDNCDINGNLYAPSEEIPCPFCRPDDFKKYQGMDDQEFEEFMLDLKNRGYEREEEV